MAGNSWTDEETYGLLDAWGDETIQSLLEGCKRNKHVYGRIAHELEENGYERTWCQCRDKIKKLKKEYKKIKDYHNETGRKRKREWKYFEKMDEILGTKPATRPDVLIDTLAGDETERASGSDEGDEGEQVEVAKEKRPVTEKSKNDEREVDDEGAKEKNVERDNSEGGNEKNKNDEKDKKDEKDKDKEKKEGKGKKEKKTARESKLDKSLNTVVTVVTNAQKESDKMFLAFEEKRLKLDETLLNIEDRRLREDKEREERQRKEEREFQLRMMMVLQRVPVTPQTMPSYQPLPYSTQSPHYSPAPYPSSSPSPYTSSSYLGWSAESTDIEDKEDC